MSRLRIAAAAVGFLIFGAGLWGGAPAQKTPAQDHSALAEQYLRAHDALTQEVLAMVQKEVDRANVDANKTNGKAWTEEESYERAVYFVPLSPPPSAEKSSEDDSKMPAIALPDIHIALDPPEHAKEVFWTDRVALAQQYVYSYGRPELQRVCVTDDPNRPCRVEVTIPLTVRQRAACVDEGPAVPRPPRGMTYFFPARHSSFFGYGGFSEGLPRLLDPNTDFDTAAASALEKQALAKLKDTDWRESQVNISATFTYARKLRMGETRYPSLLSVPRPKRLRWSDGLSEKQQLFVVQPRKKPAKAAEPTSRPADEEG